MLLLLPTSDSIQLGLGDLNSGFKHSWPSVYTTHMEQTYRLVLRLSSFDCRVWGQNLKGK